MPIIINNILSKNLHIRYFLQILLEIINQIEYPLIEKIAKLLFINFISN